MQPSSEHTAAPPKSADQVIRLTEQIVTARRLTTLMVTHSTQQAVNLGHEMVMDVSSPAAGSVSDGSGWRAHKPMPRPQVTTVRLPSRVPSAEPSRHRTPTDAFTPTTAASSKPA